MQTTNKKLNPEKDAEKIKNSAKGKEEKPKNIYKTRFSYDGFHYAEFVDNGLLRFLKYRDGRYEIVDSIEIPDPEDPDKNYRVLPAPQIAQTKKDRILQEESSEAVKFPGNPQEYESEYKLYREIKAFLHAYVELKAEDEVVLTLYTMKAVLFDVLKDSSFPFVHTIAPYGKGKSRLLTVICEITPYGFYAIDIKSAPLKRVSELYQVVLFVDEKGDMDNETSAIINAKYNRNSVVLNASKEIQQGFSSIIGYSIYGPMILAGRAPFRDDAIESKSLQVNMDFTLTRADVPRKIKGKVFDGYVAKAQELRSKLLQFRLNWHDRINDVQPSEFLKSYEDKTEARLYEVISFFDDLIEIIPEIKPEIMEVLKDQIIRNVEVARDTPNGIVAETFLSKLESAEDQCEYVINGKAYTGIYLTSIYADLGENYSKRAGRILSVLGIKTDRPRVEFTRKTQEGTETYRRKITVVRIPEDKKLNELKSRYDPEYVKAILTSVSQAQQTNLDEQDEQDEHMGNTPPKNNENIENEKKEGYSHVNRPNRPNRPASNGDPQNSDVHGEISCDALRALAFRTVEEEAPKTKYLSLTPKAIYDMIGSKAPDATVANIAKVCEQLVEEGAFLPKNKGGAYRLNPEYLNGGDFE